MPTFRDDLHLGHSVPMVDTEDIVDGAVTEPKLADDSVSTRTIQDGAVTEPKIAEKAVTEPKLADAAVSTRTIKFRAVTESKIGDSAVSTRTIQNGAVTNPKIANGAVSMNKLDNETQTLIQRGADSSWTPMGDYDVDTLYYANDLVFDPETNSSYLSLRADNMGHPVTDEEWWMKVLDGSYVNRAIEEMESAIAQAIEDAQEDIDNAIAGANTAAQAANTAAANAEAKIDWVEEQVDSLTAYEVATELDETSIIPVQNKVVTQAIRDETWTYREVELSDLTIVDGTVTQQGLWYLSGSNSNIQMPISKTGGQLKIVASSESNFVGDFLPSVNTSPINNANANRVGSRVSLSAGESKIVNIPNGAGALCMRNDLLPESVEYVIPIKGKDVTANVVESGETYYKNDIIFTSNEVLPSSVLTYDITTASSGAVFVELLDANNTRVGVFGKLSTTWTQTHFVGQIEVSSTFAKAMVRGNNITINKLETNSIKPYTEDAAYTEIFLDAADGRAVVAATGLAAEVASCAMTSYFSVIGIKRISVLIPMIGSQSYGLSFYFTPYADDNISGVVFGAASVGSKTSRWMDIDVPEGATYCRYTVYASTNANYFQPVVRLYPIDYNIDTYTGKSESALATSVLRQAKVLSEERWRYAFSSKLCIKGGTAFTTYDVSEALNADMPGYYDTKVTCISKTSLLTYNTTNVYPTENAVDTGGNSVSFSRSSFLTPVAANSNNIAISALLIINNAKNAKVASVIKSADDTFESITYTVNRLHYNDGSDHDVEFNASNYRQMLYDMGWTATKINPAGDAFDYNAFVYYDGTYYALASTYEAAQPNKQMPLVLLSSSDCVNWSVEARIGTSLYPAAEVSIAIKDNVIYVTYRAKELIMGWIIAQLDGTLISQGTFPVTRIMSRPYTFTFANDVYMAVNLDPTVYGVFMNATEYVHQARTEIGLYKVVNNAPALMRRIANPTGLHYYAMCETPPLIPDGGTAPLYKQGSIYMTFSEDRRRLYHRAFGNVSFVDITALFANNDRLG